MCTWIRQQRIAESKLPELPSFKAGFGSLNWQIPIVLDVVGRRPIRPTRTVDRELFDELVHSLRDMGRDVIRWSYGKEDYLGETYTGKRASKKFLEVQVFSLALPGATNLDLISKQENLIMLTFYGALLRDELVKSGSKTITSSPRAKQMLARILMELDKKWGLVSCIEQLGESSDPRQLIRCLDRKGTKIPVSIGQARRNIIRALLKELGKSTNGRGGEELLRFTPQTEAAINYRLKERISKAREAILRQLLSVYSSLGIVSIFQERISVNKRFLGDLERSNYWRTAREVSKEEFFDSLRSSYNKHSKRQGQNVPISMIRYDVCHDMQIPWDSFDKKLVELGYQFKGHRIGLSRGIFRKKWGLSIGNANYYYVSVIDGDSYA
jgi:hypothetical protein